MRTARPARRRGQLVCEAPCFDSWGRNRGHDVRGRVLWLQLGLGQKGLPPRRVPRRRRYAGRRRRGRREYPRRGCRDGERFLRRGCGRRLCATSAVLRFARRGQRSRNVSFTGQRRVRTSSCNAECRLRSGRRLGVRRLLPEPVGKPTVQNSRSFTQPPRTSALRCLSGRSRRGCVQHGRRWRQSMRAQRCRAGGMSYGRRRDSLRGRPPCRAGSALRQSDGGVPSAASLQPSESHLCAPPAAGCSVQRTPGLRIVQLRRSWLRRRRADVIDVGFCRDNSIAAGGG